MNVSKHKSLYFQITFSHNQFYRINLVTINSYHRIAKHIISTQKLGNGLPKSFWHQLNSYFWHPHTKRFTKKIIYCLWGFLGHY